MGKYDAMLRRLGVASGSNVPAMLAARRRMIDNVLPAADDAAELIARGPLAAELLSRAPSAGRHWGNSAAERLNARVDQARNAWGVSGSFGGIADDDVLGVVSYRRGDRGTRRHEVLHGLTEAARQGVDGMPYWARLAAADPLGAGAFLEELAATRAGGRPALLAAWPNYAWDYAMEGRPASAAAAGAMAAAQYGAVGAGAFGAGLAGTHAYHSLYPRESDGLPQEAIARQFDRELSRSPY